jgi:hypothetical protein
LELRCLKWARMTHLDTSNTSYGQKKGQESNNKIWLLTTRSQESPRFPCVQAACNILLESSRRKIQLCFKHHLNRRSAHKIMHPQSWDSHNLFESNFGNFETPAWESWDKNVIWVLVPWPGTKYAIKGKVVASFKSRPWWVWVCPWFVLAPKVFKLCINQLVVWFCASLCEWLINCHSS